MGLLHGTHPERPASSFYARQPAHNSKYREENSGGSIDNQLRKYAAAEQAGWTPQGTDRSDGQLLDRRQVAGHILSLWPFALEAPKVRLGEFQHLGCTEERWSRGLGAV